MNKPQSPLFYYFAGFALILISSAVISWLYYQQYAERLELHQLQTLEKLGMQLDSTASHYQIIADTLMENLINTPEITAIMAEATTASPAQRAVLRQKLYVTLLPLYTNLQKQHIRQFHFHLPGAISFLRFHRPDKFGDDISSVRDSIVKVNATHSKVYGFEEGRIFNGYRNVYPLFHDGVFVGTVELSYPFNALRQDALRTYSAHYHAMLKRDVVEKKVWAEEQQNYRVSQLSNNYFYDLVSRNACPSNAGITHERIKQINPLIMPGLEDELLQQKSFIRLAQLNGIYYEVAFLPLFNFKQKHVGYYVIYREGREISQMYNSFVNQTLLIGFANFTIILLLILYLRSHQIKQNALQTMATTDVLTGIPNRSHFITIFEHELNNARRYDAPLSLILFDIDHFKLVNDTYGHNAGDTILKEVSTLIRLNVRQSDLFARWGGEEFAIILPNTDKANAVLIAEKLRKKVEEHRFSESAITCSFGVSQLNATDSEESLMKRIDMLLYKAKELGRNRVESDVTL